MAFGFGFNKQKALSVSNTVGDLYARLGQNDKAITCFKSVGDAYASQGFTVKAIAMYKKLTKLKPALESVLRLAELYTQQGLFNDARAQYLQVAEEFLKTGDLEQAVRIFQKTLEVDPESTAMRMSLAAKLAPVHNDVTAIVEYANALVSAGRFDEMLQVYRQHSDRLLAGDSAKVLESLHSAIGHVRENPTALEALLELLQKAGDTTHITEVYELLAHGYVQSGELEKARDYYLKLTQLEPQNQLHTRNYQQVLARLGGTTSSARLITAEEGAVLVDELEATAPFIDQRYPDETALAIRAALTDAELFVSYNMPAKALGPLLSALPKASRDLRLNQRLAALHTRAGRSAEVVASAKKPVAVEAKAAEETIEEIRFYLAQSMIEQARAVFARLLKLKPSAATVSALREEIEAATAQVAGIEPEAIEEVSVEEAEAPAEEITPPPMPKQKPGVLKEFVSSLESSLGEGFLPQTTAKEITPHPAPAMAEVAQAAGQPGHAGVSGESVSALEASLGDSFLPHAPVPQTQVEAVPAAAHSAIAVAATAAPAAPMASAAAAAPAPQPGAPTFTYQPAKIRPLAPQKPAAPLSTGA